MKRHQLLFAAILVPLDYLVVCLAGWAAYHIRFEEIAGVLPVVEQLPQAEFMRAVFFIAWLWIIFMALSGVYTTQRRSLSNELGRVAVGASLAVLVLIVTIFFRREYVASRFIVIAGWLLSVAFLWFSHTAIRFIQRSLRRAGVGVSRVVLFGDDQTTTTVIEATHRQASLGLTIVKVFPAITLETLDEFESLIQSGEVDLAIVTDPAIAKSQSLQVLERCNDANVSFAYAADLFETEAGRSTMRDLAGIPLIEIQRTPLDGWGRILKRGVDLVGAVIGLIIFVIPGLLAALAIKLDSSGPIFIRLERVGQGQRRFRLWKFRSMIRDAHVLKTQLMAQNERGDGPLFKITNDPRITRVGRFIRKMSIDELPQLINVIAGTMSLVGPRPHEPEEVARYDRHQKKLLTIKPGMTGLAQVSGRSNLSFEEEARLDMYYIEHWSFGLDAQILLRTPLAVFNTKSAA